MSYTDEYNLINEIISDIDNLYFSNLNIINMDITDKGIGDLVTNIDLSIEKYVIDKIKKIFPDDNIIAEETRNDSKLKNRNWVFDPVDGTCNFANNIPIYGFQIAFMANEKPLLSAIFLPKMKEIYTAKYNEGSFLNGEKIKVSKNTDLQKAVISSGDFTKSNDTEIDQLSMYTKLRNKVLRFRNFGAACFDFSYVASGKTNAHIMFSRNLWDIIPGLLLVEEAGGYIVNYDGSDFDINYGAFIVSSNKEIQEELVKNLGENNE